MDAELKTGGMAKMPVGHDANTKRGRIEDFGSSAESVGEKV
jgi:hypothetical protein